MKKENKLVKTLKSNMVCTIVMIIALVLFVWACGGDLIGGLVTSAMAVIVCACVYILYKEYKAMPATSAPKAAPKKPARKRK